MSLNMSNDVCDKSFHIPSLIAKKRDGENLSGDEIHFLVRSIASEAMDKSQIGAFVMTTFIRGMSDDEISDLTRAMTASGHVFEWPKSYRHLVVDKHSTGGVGDKVSLVLAPALAACGLKVPMVSGRGLGHTGGTLDKLESIPGYKVMMSESEILDIVDRIGCCIVGQTERLVPADRALYSIRDITATVDSIPLILGSIVSKKAAEGLAALVLDVKAGKGSIRNDVKFARDLAEELVSTSKAQGINTTALLTRMDSPLGNAVGNALEVAETIECLHGNGPKRLVNLICRLGGQLLNQVNQVDTPTEGAARVAKTMRDGTAMNKFREMLKAQGVDNDTADRLCSPGTDVFTVLPSAKHKTPVTAPASGYIVEIDAKVCAEVCMKLGAGRSRAADTIKPAVGIRILRHVGDHVISADVVLEIHHDDLLPPDVITSLQEAVTLTEQPPSDNDMELVLDVIN